MRIAATATKSESANNLETVAMGVGDSSKIYRILIEGLYKDPVGSVVREIVSNGIDSHIEAGCTDRAIEVTAPSTFDSRFLVRDYGVSMTPEQIDKVFRMLTMSTKDTRDDLIGAFGLGSKTPLAYADSFTLTTFVDGYKRVYSIYMDEGDVPNINLMFEGESDEETGVEVAVPVRERDINRFHHAINEQLFFFEHPINVSNLGGGFYFSQFNCDREEYGIRYGQANSSISNGVYIVQGGVGYRLDSNFINNLDDNNANDADIMSFIRSVNGIVAIDFEIGMIDVPSTRENVKYTERTLDNIRKVIGDAVSAIRKDVAQNIVHATVADTANPTVKAKEIYTSANLNNAATGFERAMITSQIERNLEEFGDIVKQELDVSNITAKVFDTRGQLNNNFILQMLDAKDIPVDFYDYVYSTTTNRLKKESCTRFLNDWSRANTTRSLYVHNSKKSPIMRVQEDGNDEDAMVIAPKSGFTIDDDIKNKIEQYLTPFFNIKYIDDLPMPARSRVQRQVTTQPRFHIRNLVPNECKPFETNSIKDLIEEYGDTTMVLIPYDRSSGGTRNITDTIMSIAISRQLNGFKDIEFDVSLRRFFGGYFKKMSDELKDDYTFISLTEGNCDKLRNGRDGDKFITFNDLQFVEKVTAGFVDFVIERTKETADRYQSDVGEFLKDVATSDYWELKRINENLKNDTSLGVDRTTAEIVCTIFDKIVGLPNLALVDNLVEQRDGRYNCVFDILLNTTNTTTPARDMLNLQNPHIKTMIAEMETLIGEEFTVKTFINYIKECIVEYEKDVTNVAQKCVVDLEKEQPVAFAMMKDVPTHSRHWLLSQDLVINTFKEILERHV